MNNILNRQLDVVYNDKDHSYRRISDGKLLAGVSSVSELIKSKDSAGALMQWAVNCACEYVSLNIGKYPDISELLAKAKYAYKDKSTEAKDIGSDLHDILSIYIKSKIEGRPKTIICKPEQERAVEQFLKWETEQKVAWVESELLVSEEKELEIAGRLDALAFVDGIPSLIDFKAANFISSSYYVQLAGYLLALNSCSTFNPQKRLIIRLPKTDKRKIWNDKEHKYNMVINDLEVIEPKTNLEFDICTFKHAREILKYLNQEVLK